MPTGWDNEGQPVSTDKQATSGNEVTLWRNEITHGIFHKKVVETQTITSYRVFQNSTQLLLKDIDDIIVMNQQSLSIGTYWILYWRILFTYRFWKW